VSTLHAIPAGGPTLADPHRSRAAWAVKLDLEDRLQAFGDDLERWWQGEDCEYPEVTIVDARNHLLSGIKLLDALALLGPPLPLAQLEALEEPAFRPA
jgi:hypothetical protein